MIITCDCFCEDLCYPKRYQQIKEYFFCFADKKSVYISFPPHNAQSLLYTQVRMGDRRKANRKKKTNTEAKLLMFLSCLFSDIEYLESRQSTPNLNCSALVELNCSALVDL
jgi:hypothetical protein